MAADVALHPALHQSEDAHALAIPAITSAAAAILHATAAGVHAEHAGLSRIFIALAIAQGAAAVAGFLRPGRTAARALLAVNLLAVGGWLATRLAGVSWIAGLEAAQRPQLADTIAATLAIVATVASAAAAVGRANAVPQRAVVNGALLAGVLVLPGLAAATASSHDHELAGVADAAGDGHDHGEVAAAQGQDPNAAGVAVVADDHDHSDPSQHEDGQAHDDHDHDEPDQPFVVDARTLDENGNPVVTDDHTDHAEPAAGAAAWPQPWDPNGVIDFAGVPGVTAEQQARAEQLVRDTLDQLPRFADVNEVPALGYRSIGDASTGHEHYINTALIGDDKFLDPSAPESLVYQVDGDERTLVSAMFIANETPIDDPTLTDFGGPLMQWHVHDNLCWGLDDDGQPVVKGVLENFGGTCPPATVNAGGENPMVHVWIGPHECGPFAALEGHGAGQADAADGQRSDQCAHDAHAGHGADGDAAIETKPYDPALPIDLGGVPGVTLEQQAFAENLVAATVRDLPQWADLDAVDAAGFKSIGDAATGHEHYIQWDWIDDDIILDPDYPESLVFEPQPDGTKQLVSAMFMVPSGTPLDEVPDLGGPLMQWHVHGDLCFTSDPDAPKVAGLKPIGASCSPPLVDGTLAPMIHVWIRPHECGPFAALDGIGGGQVPQGEEVWCDQAHGAH